MTKAKTAKTAKTEKVEEPLFVYDGSQRFNGIPARDIYQRDVDRMSLNSRRDLLASTAYTGPDKLKTPEPPVVPDTGESDGGSDVNGEAGNGEAGS